MGNKLKVLNCVGPDEAYRLAVHGFTCGFEYEQTAKMLEEDYQVYMPKDMYETLGKLIDIQLDLDIGDRQDELEINDD